MFSQKELAPAEDQGIVFGIIQSGANATLDQTKLFADQAYQVYKSFPETKNTFEITNAGGGFGGMVVKPWNERTRTTEQLQFEAAQKLGQIPGVRIIPFVPPSLPGGGNFPVEFVVSSTQEPARVAEFAGQLVQKAYASGKFMFVDVDVKFDQPQTEVVFDRDMVRSLGVDLSQTGGDRFSIQGRSYKVIPQVERASRLQPDQLADMYVTAKDGKLVPLSTFATLRTTTEPRELKRFQQLNSVTIQGLASPGTALDTALKFLEDESKQILPQGFGYDYAGESRQLRTEGGKFFALFALSAILIYLVLAAQFESFRDPFIILVGSVPLAIAGALTFSFLGKTSLNIYSQVGLITLVGLVSKNGILIVEFSNHLQEQGRDKLHAVIEAAGTRLRPILMTTAATVVGHLPLVFAKGPGAGARNSIGIMLVSGMIIGTAFTLFVVPSIYMLVARRHVAERETELGRAVAEAEAGAAA
jgi:multidrug efflux pump